MLDIEVVVILIVAIILTFGGHELGTRNHDKQLQKQVAEKGTICFKVNPQNYKYKVELIRKHL